jgi:hypothetical protein
LNEVEDMTIKFEMFPLEKNKVIVRIENIGDRFDGV